MLLLENAMFLVLMVVTSISELGRVAIRNSRNGSFDGSISDNAGRNESVREHASRRVAFKTGEKQHGATGICLCRVERFAAFF
jgi:hypothetical protein